WIVGRMLKLGNYGTTGMGGPLLLLATCGIVSLRRNASLLALLVAPMGLMFLANAAGFYPLEDRLFFFALPWLWLLAAVGIESIVSVCRGRRRTVAIVFALMMLVPGVVRYTHWTAVVPAKVEFREAFEFVRSHERPGDGWWVSHPEVAEAYFDSNRTTTPDGERVWMIVAHGADDGGTADRLSANGLRCTEQVE